MQSYKRKKRVRNILIVAILILVSFTMLIPFWWMITTSLDWAAVTRVPFPPRFWPKEFSWQAIPRYLRKHSHGHVHVEHAYSDSGYDYRIRFIGAACGVFPV